MLIIPGIPSFLYFAILLLISRCLCNVHYCVIVYFQRPQGRCDMTDIDRISILTISIFFINSILISSKFLFKSMLTFSTTKICQYYWHQHCWNPCVDINIVRLICEVDHKWCPRLLTTATDHGRPCEVKLPNFGLILFDNVVPIWTALSNPFLPLIWRSVPNRANSSSLSWTAPLLGIALFSCWIYVGLKHIN